MPSSQLWACSTKGNVYSLSTDDNSWTNVVSEGQCIRGFKKIAPTFQGAWGLGCDHQIFVFVSPSDVPVRCQEVTYENERWIPSQGWSGKNLLPLDPFQWSNEEGSVPMAKEDVKLPSDDWLWESDWYVDENVHGYVTDKGGYRYANIDFSKAFSHKKTFRSCVRRRRWIRYRRYNAVGRWAKVENVTSDPLADPVVDLSAGGQDMPNQAEGFVSLWMVTINGALWFRHGISRLSPQGQSWQKIELDEASEIFSISVGPQGHLWAVSWSGEIFVRNGITWQTVKGNGWTSVPSPCEEPDRIVQVAVGVKIVWAVSDDGKVWVRLGIDSGDDPDKRMIGTSWLRMVTKMRRVCVGPNDQVWGIDFDDRHIHFRMGVTSEEITGREWKLMLLPHKSAPRKLRHPSNQSISSKNENNLDLDNGPLTIRGISVSSTEVKASESDDDIYMDTEDTTRENDNIRSSAYNANVNKYVGDVNSIAMDTACADNCDISELNQDSVQNDALSLSTHNEYENKIDKNVNIGAGACGENENSGAFASVNEKGHVCNDEVISVVWDGHSDKFTTQAESLSTKETNGPKSNYKPLKAKTKIGRHLVNFAENLKVIDKVTGNKQATGKIVKLIKQGEKETTKLFKVMKDGKGEEKDGAVSFSFSKDNPNMQLNFKAGSNSQISRQDSQGESQNIKHGSHNSLQSIGYSPSLSHKPISPDSASLDSNFQTQSSLAEQNRAGYEDSQSESSFAIEDDYWLKYDTQPDDEEIQWLDVGPNVCIIRDNQQIRKWFEYHTVSGQLKKSYSMNSERAAVLQLLKKRYTLQVAPYTHYQIAIERGCWTKRGKMKWYQDQHRGHKWVDCALELTQDADSHSKDGSLTVQYQIGGAHKHIQLDLKGIKCARVMTDAHKASVWAVYVMLPFANTPVPKAGPAIKLQSTQEEDMEDWIGSISSACWNLEGRHHLQSMLALTERGDVFVHEPEIIMPIERPQQLCWHPMGGHLKIIESGSGGVCWGIGYDGTAYVHTGGYGGGFMKGIPSSPSVIHHMTDTRVYHVYENQRWRLVSGYTEKVFFVNHYMWSDKTGKVEKTKDSVKLMSKHWHWSSDWTVDHKTPGGVDQDGWQYARNFVSNFYPRPKLRSVLRRRRWKRKCSITTSGPWLEVGPLPLHDISIQMDQDSNFESPIAVWAVGLNGDVLCRMGVTALCPKGIAWAHVPTDLPFVAVSVGGELKVWAIAKDGSAWFRNSITVENPIGQSWLQVPPPSQATLSRISVGKSHVWALDTKAFLWFRKNITPATPEGTEWVMIERNCKHVSVGPNDQVWTVLDNIRLKEGVVNGVISQRVFTTADSVTQGTWEHGIGNGWTYVSARAWQK